MYVKNIVIVIIVTYIYIKSKFEFEKIVYNKNTQQL